MKRIQAIICLGVCCFLTACAGKGEEKGDGNRNAAAGSAQAAGEREIDSGTEGAETDYGIEEPEIDSGTEDAESVQVLEPTEILVENPSQEYYLTEAIASEDEMFLSLEKLTEEPNDIIDTGEWFQQNELPAFDSFHMEDENYRYEILGDNYASGYLLSIYEKEEHGPFLERLDFSDYRYTDNIKEGDWDFVEQRVWWAQSVDDVLYVAVSHNTYTESCPHTGYLAAIDLNDAHVIWKSAPCMTNGYNFEIIDDTIVCGYGFTAEPDYLNLVSRLDGTLIEQIPIRSKADYIIRKDDILYVRTYNTNYTFQIQRAIACK
ncbi:MAG: hypothetical protein NC341_03330 [Blautia sp.]|nr:hypothetical protein [Blautia sp.]MCM1200652.1 hypothetical protein [Bacteroides fragilis]